MDLLKAQADDGEAAGWLLAVDDEERLWIELLIAEQLRVLEKRVTKLARLTEIGPTMSDPALVKAELERAQAQLHRGRMMLGDIRPAE